MILHPTILALLSGSLLAGLLLAFASRHAVAILRHWDIRSGSERQLELERRTYLISTIVAYVCAFEVAALFLFLHAADDLAPLFAGAMCAAGTLFVNPFGYPALALQTAGAVLSGTWLVVNHADSRGSDYPFVREKHGLLLAVAAVALAGTAAQAAYFAGLKADVITSCCGSLFGGAAAGIPADLAALPVFPMQVAFYAVTASILLFGAFCLRGAPLGALVGALGAIASLVFAAALISFISPYIYELPTHHCPFCILQKEYHFVGYLMHGSLLAGLIASLGLLWLRGRTIPSLQTVLPSLVRRLVLVVMVCFGLFAAAATYAMLATPFRLGGY